MSSLEHTQNGLFDFNKIDLIKLYACLPAFEQCKWSSDFRDYYMYHKNEHKSFSNLHSSDVVKLFHDYLDFMIQKAVPYMVKPELLTIQVSNLVRDYLEYKYIKRFDFLFENYPELWLKII